MACIFYQIFFFFDVSMYDTTVQKVIKENLKVWRKIHVILYEGLIKEQKICVKFLPYFALIQKLC